MFLPHEVLHIVLSKDPEPLWQPLSKEVLHSHSKQLAVLELSEFWIHLFQLHKNLHLQFIINKT